MNEQLKREEEDLCGKRGLEPNSERQTFEVEVPFKFREQYEDVVRPLRQADVQQQRRNLPNNPTGKFLACYPKECSIVQCQITPEVSSWPVTPGNAEVSNAK